MAKLPTQVLNAIETLLDNISDDDCIDGVIKLNINKITWKLTITKSKEKEISLLIRRQKRITTDGN
jgi:hypothetical protein